MKRLLFVCLLLSACGGRAADPAANAENAECRAEARQAQSVRDLSRQVVLGNPASEERARRAREQAESVAYTDCLRRRGLVRGGGVEPLRRPGL